MYSRLTKYFTAIFLQGSFIQMICTDLFSTNKLRIKVIIALGLNIVLEIQVHNILSCQFMETCFILQFVPYFYSDFGKCFCSYVFRLIFSCLSDAVESI